ncbi:MAG: hypothetical protein H6Q52_2478 [Deltaproteobacteria bacterium]|nr:hypothetical protein [Deltaproteobacteria bacterium]
MMVAVLQVPVAAVPDAAVKKVMTIKKAAFYAAFFIEYIMNNVLWPEI